MSDILKVANFAQGAYDSFCQAVSDTGDLTVAGRRLRYQVRGYFYRWELNFEAEVVDVATGVVGKAENYVSKDKTVQFAIQDLFSKLGLPNPTEEDSGDTAIVGATAEDDRPSLVHLLSYPMTGGENINIPEEIGMRYKPFGILLLQDHTGAVVDGISHKNQNAPFQINLDILQKWGSGGAGMKPISWRTLVDCLKKTGMTTLAENIEQTLS